MKRGFGITLFIVGLILASTSGAQSVGENRRGIKPPPPPPVPGSQVQQIRESVAISLTDCQRILRPHLDEILSDFRQHRHETKAFLVNSDILNEVRSAVRQLETESASSVAELRALINSRRDNDSRALAAQLNEWVRGNSQIRSILDNLNHRSGNCAIPSRHEFLSRTDLLQQTFRECRVSGNEPFHEVRFVTDGNRAGLCVHIYPVQEEGIRYSPVQSCMWIDEEEESNRFVDYSEPANLNETLPPGHWLEQSVGSSDIQQLYEIFPEYDPDSEPGVPQAFLDRIVSYHQDPDPFEDHPYCRDTRVLSLFWQNYGDITRLSARAQHQALAQLSERLFSNAPRAFPLPFTDHGSGSRGLR